MPQLAPGVFRGPRGFTLIELLAVVGVLVVLVALLLPALNGMFSRAAAAKCVNNLKQISAASASFSADNKGAWPHGQTNNQEGGGGIFVTEIAPYLDRLPGRGDADFRSSVLICPGTPNEGEDSNYLYQGVYTPLSISYTDPDETVRVGVEYAQNINAVNARPSGNSASYHVKNRNALDRPSAFMLYMDYHGNHLTAWASLTKNDGANYKIVERKHNKKVNIAYADGSVRPMLLDDVPPQNPKTTEPGSSFWYGKNGN